MAIVWWNFNSNKQTRFFIYSLDDRSENFYSLGANKTCINEQYEKINIFPSKTQFAFSCIIQDEFVQILLFDRINLTSNYDFY